MLRIYSLFVIALLFAIPVDAAEFSGRVKFIDGDTLDVGRVRVRVHGIDAPEMSQTCKRDNGKIWSCGKWSKKQARKYFDGKTATCRPQKTDRYGRTVAVCFVGGRDIADVLVRAGAAKAYRRYSRNYIDAEKAASIADRGIWAGTMIDPEKYRFQQREATPQQSSSNGCKIKGNISKSGKIYHVPGQKYYQNTKISKSKGERWFCSEAEARAAGWRRSKI